MVAPLMLLAVAQILARFGYFDLLGDRGVGQTVPAILPLADILSDIGTAFEGQFPLLTTVLVSLALARKPRGHIAWASLASWVCYWGATQAMARYGVKTEAGAVEAVDYGILAGVIVGLITAILWNSFEDIKFSGRLEIFSGIPAATFIATFSASVLGLVMGAIFPVFHWLIVGLLGAALVSLPPLLAAFFYGLLDPVMTALGLTGLWQRVPMFGYGECQSPAGGTIHGSYSCFISGGAQTTGQDALFLSGGFPTVFFGLTTLIVAAWFFLKKADRAYWSIFYLIIALASFLAGADEPGLYLLILAAFPVFLIHSILSACAFAVSALLDSGLGYVGGPGLIDLLMHGTWGLASLVVLGIGVALAAGYCGIFYSFVRNKPGWLHFPGYSVTDSAPATHTPPPVAPRQVLDSQVKQPGELPAPTRGRLVQDGQVPRGRRILRSETSRPRPQGPTPGPRGATDTPELG
ncbi:MAG: PTS transporter subunit EIIC [Actinomycetaceae bacterium]|nr:PTS transporter subunit EIIC [Actinomycetaceae bacterium]